MTDFVSCSCPETPAQPGALICFKTVKSPSMCRGQQVIQEIALGLNFVHSKGIAHNDLKSSNVLLHSTEGAKITDVALGKLLADASEEFSAPRIQSIAWCAPERRAFDKCSLQSDIYALGVIIWEVKLLTIVCHINDGFHI